MTWVQTRTGREFNFKAMSVESVDPVDIAHALGYLCRFNGHTNRFYSVAEHSCRMYDYWVPHRIRDAEWDDLNVHLLRGAILVHDAHEAYVGDVVRPLKQAVPELKRIEGLVADVVRERLLGDAYRDHEMWSFVSDVDLEMLAAEGSELMRWPKKSWKLAGHERLLEGSEFDLAVPARTPEAWSMEWFERFKAWELVSIEMGWEFPAPLSSDEGEGES